MSLIKHGLFWLCVFLYFLLTSNIENYGGGYPHLFHSVVKFISLQILTAVVIIYILVPKFLNQKKTPQFIFWCIVLLIGIFILYTLINMYLYEPRYVKYYNAMAKEFTKDSFFKRLTYFNVFLGKSIKFLTPTALLLMARFYKSQQQLLQLKEQKKAAELSALKHQLNPHFLFNTLNNLYSLAIEKSDKTPEVIERLSDILDYILYRCKDTFVPVDKEIELVENYLTLEKLRYGKRVDISFTKAITDDIKIAPLILLTFIENAFKHSVKQELNKAEITIELSAKKELFRFKIKNTKPEFKSETSKEPLGLKNVKNQLNLLYGEQYDLNIVDTDYHFLVTLTLKPN